MEFFCPNCKEMPLINFVYLQKGKILAVIRCKCGKKFHDISTFIDEYTNIIQKDEKTESKIKIEEPKNDKNLISFCYNCFENIYDDNKIKEEHDTHNIIKIDKNNDLISDEEFDKITQNLAKTEEKVNNYLHDLEKLLIDNAKDKDEVIKIKNISSITIFKNILLLKFFQSIYELYKTNKENNTLTFQIIQNLKNNSDYNLNKYKLDIQNINKERFISYFKSCFIICCNRYINKIYQNYVKEKEELTNLILKLKPLKEFNGDDTPVKFDKMMKSNSSFFYGEKSEINELAYGRGILICENGSHYFGYFKNDYFQDGFGKSINSDGSTYLGNFGDGVPKGYGKFINKSGNIYEGEWKDSQLDGFGHIICNNKKLEYFGEMKKGIFCGYGILKQKIDDIVYQGEYFDGKMEGIGKIIYKNRKEYIGQFKEGTKNGYGIMKWVTKEVYEGEWINDTFKFGQYSWPNGNIFFGNFQNTSVNGFGTFYIESSGTFETGTWENGKRVNIDYKDNLPTTRYLSYL